MEFSIQNYLQEKRKRVLMCFPVEGKHINKISGLAVFLAHFMVILAAYQLLLNFHLSGDGYAEATNGYSPIAFINLGRYTAAILTKAMELVGIITIASHQQLFTVFFLIISSLFSYVILCLFQKYVPNKSIS